MTLLVLSIGAQKVSLIRGLSSIFIHFSSRKDNTICNTVHTHSLTRYSFALSLYQVISSNIMIRCLTSLTHQWKGRFLIRFSQGPNRPLKSLILSMSSITFFYCYLRAMNDYFNGTETIGRCINKGIFSSSYYILYSVSRMSLHLTSKNPFSFCCL